MNQKFYAINANGEEKMSINENKRLSILSTIQNGLPEIRKGLGLSQDSFGKLIGKTRQIISLIERNESELTWETCLAIITVVVNRDPKLLAKLYGDSFKKDLQEILNK